MIWIILQSYIRCWVQYNINLKELIHADDPPEMQRRMVDDTKRTTDDVSAARAHAPQQASRANVSRSEMVQRQLQAQQERKNQEIIENVKRRNERISEKQQERKDSERWKKNDAESAHAARS